MPPIDIKEIRLRYSCPECRADNWVFTEHASEHETGIFECWFCKNQISWEVTMKENEVA